ncbi:toxin-antitoxin system YwqK family antitoxin [Salibacteraceae bacterium]|nr:toxin-antitoxin system YwqK family antitoxin [Salibacteraceae bacterium]
MKFIPLLIFLFASAITFGQNATNADGRRVGAWIVKGVDSKKPGYSDDAIVEKGNYANGRKVGLWVTYFPSGKVKSEITHINGRPKGPYKTFYENGKIEDQGNWALNKQTGDFKRYYENGQVSQNFSFNDSGKRDGKQVYYHENGQVMIEGNWAGGKEDGEIKEYFSDGSVKSVRVFHGGQMDDSKSSFKNAPSASVAVKTEPEPVKDESNNIKVSQKVTASTAKPNTGLFDGNGQHTLYNRNRQISQKGVFRGGRLYTGKVFKYNDDGILTNVEMYQSGKYIGEGVIDKNMQ